MHRHPDATLLLIHDGPGSQDRLIYPVRGLNLSANEPECIRQARFQGWSDVLGSVHQSILVSEARIEQDTMGIARCLRTAD